MLSMEQYTGPPLGAQHMPMSFEKANENWTGHSGQPLPSAPAPDKPPSLALAPRALPGPLGAGSSGPVRKEGAPQGPCRPLLSLTLSRG